jgi:hypothetical protein
MRIHNFSRRIKEKKKGFIHLKDILKAVFILVAALALNVAIVAGGLFVALFVPDLVESLVAEVNWSGDPCFKVIDGKGGPDYSIKDGRVCIPTEAGCAEYGGWGDGCVWSRWVYRSLKEADAATFQEIEYGGWSLGKDKNHVYHGDEVLPLDGTTLKVWDDKYLSDNRSVFYELEKIEGADGSTFLWIGKEFGKDAKRVYWRNKAIDGADPNSFSVLDSNNGKDSRHVFFMDKIVESADPATFRLISKHAARDGRHVFAGDRPIEGADPDTFMAVPNDDKKYPYTSKNYYKDKDSVFEIIPTGQDGEYVLVKKVDGVDAATIRWVEYRHLRDKDHCYLVDDRLSVVPEEKCTKAVKK